MNGQPPIPPTVAYLSMEIGLNAQLPTYAGGLGVLAGDFLRAAADMGLGIVGVSLVHRAGYFFQRLDAEGNQFEEPVRWSPEDHFAPLEPRVLVTLEDRPITIRAWQHHIVGVTGRRVPVLCLDTDLPENSPTDRLITHHLYTGDAAYRLKQEAVLGIGGLRMLRALGYVNLQRYHMNEGHAALLVLELLDEEARAQGCSPTESQVIDAVRRRCVFTTHTPIAAGHDKFPLDLVRRILEPRHTEPYRTFAGRQIVCCEEVLNMTFLGFNGSHFINGVAKRHSEVSRQLFGQYPIDSITNGVHAATWASPSMSALFDKHISGWREDNLSLRYAHSIDGAEIWSAHQAAKQALVGYVNQRTNAGLDVDWFTIGIARRAALYKRADLILSDIERLKRISRSVGPLQIIFAGKAHPGDEGGKAMIRGIFRAIQALKPDVQCEYLPNYDIDTCKLLVAGVDLWLNTPQPPLEASGTSGMKAAINGVPSLSILDGWWLEGCLEGLTGWAIGIDRWPSKRAVNQEFNPSPSDNVADATSLYDKLEQTILPMFNRSRLAYVDVMRHAVAINGSFFNAQRMLQQYVSKAYL